MHNGNLTNDRRTELEVFVEELVRLLANEAGGTYGDTLQRHLARAMVATRATINEQQEALRP